ncbi:MAG TPA: FecR family protein [Polyangiaceae bacterium]|jgi:transmembrane sensor
MSGLPVPTGKALRSDVDDVTLERMWRNVQRRRAERARRAPRVRWVAALAAVAAVVAMLLLRDRTPTMAGPGPLRLEGGGEITALAAQETAVRTVSFSEGSRIELAPGARLQPLENGPTAFSSLLVNGRATFDVRPGGPRRWTVECGMATVEVVGTRFTVERSPGHARVSVERGVVLVRGERVRDRVQRLEAGGSVDVEDVPAATVPPAPTASAAAVVPSSDPMALRVSPLPGAPTQAPAAAPGSAVWRSLAQRGDNADAYAELGPGGIASASRSASVEDLLALADVARLSGHPGDAVTPLSRVLSEHADDPRAPLAAFTLGRLELDTLMHPALAAEAFARAIALGLPQSLQEDAHARLVEARARAGDTSGARAAAQDYEQRFPAGKRLDEVRRWTRTE